VFVGHRALSYLSSTSTKQKTAWGEDANRSFGSSIFEQFQLLGSRSDQKFSWATWVSRDNWTGFHFVVNSKNLGTRKVSRTSPSCMMHWCLLNRLDFSKIELIRSCPRQKKCLAVAKCDGCILWERTKEPCNKWILALWKHSWQCTSGLT
jgi:hypothetical protein